MKTKKTKDVLREFIKAHLPGLRKTSLSTEIEILDDFVNKRQSNPKSKMYSREFLDKTPNINYHLGRLHKAGALKSENVELAAFVVDLAEEDSNRIKRGLKQIKQVRELRLNKLIEHAKKDGKVCSIIYSELGVKSITDIWTHLAYTRDYNKEKVHHSRYNQIVNHLKTSGIQLEGYDQLIWRNPAKPWKVTDELISCLRDAGIFLGA